MQQTTDDFDRLVAIIQQIDAGLVMIDGCTLVGKTRLAHDLADRLSAVAIDADDFIKRRQDAFVDALRAGELKAAVHAALASSKIVLLSGICARDVADQAALSPTLYVYVQRNTTVDVVADMDIIDAEDGVQNEFQTPWTPRSQTTIGGSTREGMPMSYTSGWQTNTKGYDSTGTGNSSTGW